MPKEWVSLEECMPKDPNLRAAYAVVYKLLTLHTLLRIREPGCRHPNLLRQFYDQLNLTVELVAAGLERGGESNGADSKKCGATKGS